MTSGSHTSPPVFWLVSGISLLLYTITLAPSVTLEYSGSLVTAADSLGVANPPGYPVWTLLAWFFQKLFGFVRYHGAPNPAWGVNFMSAFFGSLSCGLVAHMVSRSVRSESRGVSDPQASCAAWIAGTSAGLLFAFSPFMWAQSVIAETNTLNVFSVVLFLALLQGGVLDDGKRFLYPLAFLLGIGFLNSPTFVLMIPLFAAAWAKRGTWRQVPALLLCLALGLLPMAYLPLASAQNPPVNWGYARTLDGFIHLVTRGQYEHMTLTPVFSAPDVFLAQMATYIRLLAAQFSTPVLVLGIPALFGMRHGGLWKPALLAAFLLYGTGTTIGMNPPLDHQTLYYCRVVWIPSYALAAILIGLGLGWIFSAASRHRPVLASVFFAALLLPLVPLVRQQRDRELVRVYGGSSQSGHDFGWQFGRHQLEGLGGIVADLQPGETPLPARDYPPPLERGALLFGGTDPGRFVPTYMIFSAGIRPDVFLLTQNALADRTYLNALRDLYGGAIRIPSPADADAAFYQYMEELQAGRLPPGTGAKPQGDRVTVQGVAGVMAINGILARRFFEANKDRHAFYIEESYVIPWMFPHLAPHGLIMRLHAEPLPSLPPELVNQDRAFWNWYSRRLLDRPAFLRDVAARRSFCKLRCAIAGLYAYRGLFDEAEYAFRQALALYPDSPEANYRLADVLMQRRKFNDAEAVIAACLRADPGNDKVRSFLELIRRAAAGQ